MDIRENHSQYLIPNSRQDAAPTVFIQTNFQMRLPWAIYVVVGELIVFEGSADYVGRRGDEQKIPEIRNSFTDFDGTGPSCAKT